MNLSTNVIYISWDVIFHGSIFHFQSTNSTLASRNFLFELVLPSSFPHTFHQPFSPSHNLISLSLETSALSPSSHFRLVRVTWPPSYLKDFYYYSTTSHSSSLLIHSLMFLDMLNSFHLIMPSSMSFLFMLSLLSLHKLLLFPSGAKQCKLNFRLLNKIKLGLSLLSHLVNIPWAASGYIISNSKLMAFLSNTKLSFLLKVILSKRVLIILILSLPWRS